MTSAHVVGCVRETEISEASIMGNENECLAFPLAVAIMFILLDPAHACLLLQKETLSPPPRLLTTQILKTECRTKAVSASPGMKKCERAKEDCFPMIYYRFTVPLYLL